MSKRCTFIALSNQKGGVGKSTMTVLLASYFHYVMGKRVAVVDCDYPQFSIQSLRTRDMQNVEKSEYLQRMLYEQHERTGQKAYPVLTSGPDKVLETALRLTDTCDVVFFDLPGTVNSPGVLETIINMDYLFTPVVQDRMVMQSSLSFSTTVLDYIRDRPEIPLKDILFFWNKIERRANTEVFDIYRMMMQRLKLTVLETTVPDTCRYDKELSVSSKSYFRCTLLPPPAKLLKGSGFVELANELKEKLKL